MRPVATTCRSVCPGLKPWSNGMASRRKLNLRRNLRWVAKRTRKFSLKYTWVTKNKAEISCISLANNSLMDVAQLALTSVGWPNGKKLALTCVPIWPRPAVPQSMNKYLSKSWTKVVLQSHSGWKNEVYSWFLYTLYYVNYVDCGTAVAVDSRRAWVAGYSEVYPSPGQTDRQVDASWTCEKNCVGWPNGLASFLASTRKSQIKTF